MIKIKNGFTFLELLVVVIVIGIITAFVVPDYGRTQEFAREKAAVDDLEIIDQAMRLYYSRNGDFAQNLLSITDINDALKTNITTQPSMLYQCDYDLAPVGIAGAFYCMAEDQENNWIVFLDYGVSLEDDPYPECHDNTCPRCRPSPTGCPWDR